jgi:hypothetical protein
MLKLGPVAATLNRPKRIQYEDTKSKTGLVTTEEVASGPCWSAFSAIISVWVGDRDGVRTTGNIAQSSS